MDFAKKERCRPSVTSNLITEIVVTTPAGLVNGAFV